MNSIAVKAGTIIIGGESPVIIQTMCNTRTQDVERSVAQCEEMAAKGAALIRLTIQGPKEIEALKEIKRILREKGIETPLVADVHFSSEVAIAVAGIADKVRINPGNFAREHEEAKRQFARFIAVCKEYGTAVRIGLNHGSLGERIIHLYGDTPLGMKEAAMEWIKMCTDLHFQNIVISLKASNTVVMVNAYRLLKEALIKKNLRFPLHLGVTEAGNGDMGRIKSAVGIGSLLKDNIGDTIRVSLTEDPVNELSAAKIIAGYFNSGDYQESYQEIKELMREGNIPAQTYKCHTWEEFILKASCDFGPLLLDKIIDDFNVGAIIDDVPVSPAKIEEFKENLLQASRRKFTRPEYIACPGCGRTQYDLEKTFNEVKRRTAHLNGVVIAVMGCIVNGPGEMADADYGYVGEGKGKVAIYRGKKAVMRSVPQEEAIDALLRIIEEDALQKDVLPRS